MTTISTRTTFIRLATVGALAIGPFLAEAASAEGGVYVAGSYGHALSTFHQSDIDDGVKGQLNARGAIDSSDARMNRPIWSAGVGYLLSPRFGFEASYLNLGTLTYNGVGSGTGRSDIRTLDVDFETRSHGPALTAVWAQPMSNVWGVDARLGLCRVKSSTDFTVTIDDNPRTGTETASSTSVLLGVGTSLSMSTHIVLRLDYLYLRKIKEKLLERDFDASLVTAGLAYVF